MNNKRGGAGTWVILVLILMLASAVGGAYAYRVLDGKMAVNDAMKAVEEVDISDYDSPEQTIIQGYIDDTTKDLQTAKTRKEVYLIIGEFIDEVGKVQTKNQKELEQALKEAEEAKKKYEESQQQNNQNGSGITDAQDGTGSSSGNSTGSSNTGSSSGSGSDSGGSYKSNDLSSGSSGSDDDDKGFLGSLLGGLANGAN